MKKLAIFAVMAVLIGLPTWALANSVSYVTSTPIASSTLTDWATGTTLAFQKFDPSLGTLTEIEISLSSGMDTVITVQNLGGSSSSGSAFTQVLVTLDDPSHYISGNGDTPEINMNTGSQTYSLNIDESKTLAKKTTVGGSDNSYTIAAMLAEFTGTGDILLDASTSTHTWLDNTGGNTTAGQITHAGLTGTITYYYTPVPIPPTALLLGSGLIGLLALGRRKKKHSA